VFNSKFRGLTSIRRTACQCQKIPARVNNIFYRAIWLKFIFLTLFISQIASATAPDKNQSCNTKSIQKQQKKASFQRLLSTTDRKKSEILRSQKETPKITEEYTYKIINKIPHAVSSFTQGLVFNNGYLYEGTGLIGASGVYQLNIETGDVVKAQKTDRYIFGEGISVIENQLLQLSWKSERAQVYDLETLKKTGEFKYQGEGWGATSMGRSLIISNGTSSLKWINHLDQDKSQKYKEITVFDSGVEVQGLNEIEYVDGFIYANVWPTDCIAKIDASTGDVIAWVNFTNLYPQYLRLHWTAVLNGIAYNSEKEIFYITGKYWPNIYEIELVPLN